MLEVGDAEDVGSDDSHRVRGVDEKAMLTKDHVSVLDSQHSGREERRGSTGVQLQTKAFTRCDWI